MPSRTIQADLDYADPVVLQLLPTVLVRTSPGRHQGFWVCSEEQDVASLEALARRIAYGVPECDLTGWSAGHRMRVPNTISYKYEKPALIEIAALHLREISPEAFNIFPDLLIAPEEAQAWLDWVTQGPVGFEIGPLEMLQTLKGKVRAQIFTQYGKAQRDRSAALWALTCEAFKAGMNRDEVYHLALNSANNKFSDRKYHGAVDLRKDILRAEKYVVTRQTDFKAVILDLRQDKGDQVSERRKRMGDFVVNIMRENGEFVHAKSGSLHYVRKDTGRPILITQHSEWLNAYLNSVFGLNTTEVEQRYVVHELISYTRSLHATTDMELLSYYDTMTESLLLHTGGRDVLHISKDGIENHPNGYGAAVFNWINSHDVWMPGNSAALSQPWYEIMFTDSLNYVLGIEKDEALAMLRSWFLFLLFRNLPTTRPILALLGQPGSGKTSIAKRLYRLIYGRSKNVSGLVDSESFDNAVVNNPFIAFDNLDTWERWLPDKLALCASVTDVDKRKLYTDNDILSYKRQALVCITAHNPKFTREDITDRLLLLMFSRIPHFRSETEFLEVVSRQRNALWAAIIEDVQAVLRTAKPRPGEAPQFRIEDFSYYGLWFARANGPAMEDSFKRAIKKVQGGQRSFNLEEDQLLVSAITKLVRSRKHEPKFDGVETLFSELSACSTDSELFRRLYKGAQQLGRKLWVMQDSLKQMFEVEWKFEPTTQARVWKLSAKAQVIGE